MNVITRIKIQIFEVIWMHSILYVSDKAPALAFLWDEVLAPALNTPGEPTKKRWIDSPNWLYHKPSSFGIMFSPTTCCQLNVLEIVPNINKM
jgi:hypothetical protein